MGAIELESRTGAPGARGAEVFARAWDAGLLVRVTGDIIALSPPLIVGAKEIDEMFSILGRVLRDLS
jgi:beta-alanine--pyruvate transaminase